MSVRIYSGSLPGDLTHENEDAVWASPEAALIVDGATPLQAGVGLGSPAANFVRRLVGRLQGTLTPGINLQDAVLDARDVLGQEGETPDLASTSLALVTIEKGRLRYLVIGDCCLAHVSQDGTIRMVRDETVPRLDDAVALQVRGLQEDGLSYEAAVARCLPDLRRNRAQTTGDGGHALSSLPGQVPQILTGETSWRSGDQVLLCSDGFARLVDLFRVFPDFGSLAVAVRQEGVEPMVGRLRQIEARDRQCLQYPRLKISDDASAVLLTDVTFDAHTTP